MDIAIRKLTPELAEDYARFFDTTPHDNGETKCYCVTWCNDRIYHNGGSHWFASAEERRLNAIQRVQDGNIQGYLAYYGDKIVGWCNANTKEDCQAGMGYLRSECGVPLDECRAGERTKFIFCYAIAPEFQRKGVATQLLKHICQDSAVDGYNYVEAYVNKTFEVHDFRGHLAMYEKCGFTIYAEKEGKIIVRKSLK